MSLLPTRQGRGLILGKFMPPHRGHEYLFRFATAYAGDVVIVVDCLVGETIPVVTRVAWVKELCPGATVVGLDTPTPQQPSEHPDFWNYWGTTLRNAAQGQVDYLFASADYGEQLAQAMGAKHISCDVTRAAIPLTATQIRGNPQQYWSSISAPAQRYFRKKIVLMGPESTGKTTMATQLAQELQTTWVPEYAVEYLRTNPKTLTRDDLEIFLRAQLASQQALEPTAGYHLLCDTDYLSTQVWGRVLLGLDLARPEGAQLPDLTLLLAPNVAWVPDGHRNVLVDAHKDQVRWDFFELCIDRLKSSGVVPTSLGEQQASLVC